MRRGSKTTIFETRLERSELVKPARGIIRVTGETSDTKRGHVVVLAGIERTQKPWGRTLGVISIFCGYPRILSLVRKQMILIVIAPPSAG